MVWNPGADEGGDERKKENEQPSKSMEFSHYLLGVTDNKRLWAISLHVLEGK